jgi:hypothetical protein
MKGFTYVDSLVECAESGQVNERRFVDGQPNADTQNPRTNDLKN